MQVYLAVALFIEHLLPLADHSEGLVVDHYGDDGLGVDRRGHQLLGHHLERTVAREADHALRTRVALVSTAILVLGVSAFLIFVSLRTKNSVSNPGIAEKSLAVLPFENLSGSTDNSYFADGVQDEILTALARVADLKVIGRPSVMQYKSGVARNLREIGHQLGVANVLEGSVQRVGNRVRVNAQLIDTRSDRHLWAQTFDRDVTDVFAVEDEIAETIADQLKAKLSPAEKSAIERVPTTDLTAFDLYTRAKNLILAGSWSTPNTNLREAAGLLDQAIARDPSFFDAYCQLAWTHEFLYIFGLDHSPGRLALAEAAIEAAFRLRPDAGEAHLARAWNLYLGHLDYDGALAELEVARHTLPNEPQVVELQGYIERRQGRWAESTRNLERAIELDPRNVRTLTQTAVTYRFSRRHAEEKSLLDRASTVVPNDAEIKAECGVAELDWKAYTRQLRQIIDSTRATNPAAMAGIADNCLICALAEHDARTAENALLALPETGIRLVKSNNVNFSRAFVKGLIARMTKDDAKAQVAFTAARLEQEKVIQAQPSYGPALCVLGLIDAALGRKEEALREGRQAVELLPVGKDAFEGPVMVKYLAIIAAWVGDNDLACDQLATVIRGPSDLSYGQLKLMPWWDPLRGDPRFEKLVQEAKQPVALK